jgi:hypothetical protein
MFGAVAALAAIKSHSTGSKYMRYASFKKL